jgi:hypothetical protein
MCDYSLHHVETRPAKVGDKLTTRNFGTGTHGFAAQENKCVAVCLLPGTELSFADAVTSTRPRVFGYSVREIPHKTAIFRQVNLDNPYAHHDALEFPDGEIVLLTYLMERQEAAVLQLPATGVEPKELAQRGASRENAVMT